MKLRSPVVGTQITPNYTRGAINFWGLSWILPANPFQKEVGKGKYERFLKDWMDDYLTESHEQKEKCFINCNRLTNGNNKEVWSLCLREKIGEEAIIRFNNFNAEFGMRQAHQFPGSSDLLSSPSAAETPDSWVYSIWWTWKQITLYTTRRVKSP